MYCMSNDDESVRMQATVLQVDSFPEFKMPNTEGMSTSTSILMICASVVGLVITLWARGSTTWLKYRKEKVEGSFVEGLQAELAKAHKATEDVRAEMRVAVETIKLESHGYREKWNECTIALTIRTQELAHANRELLEQAEDHLKLVTEFRDVGHANQGLKQLLVIYGPKKIHSELITSQFGKVDKDALQRMIDDANNFARDGK